MNSSPTVIKDSIKQGIINSQQTTQGALFISSLHREPNFQEVYLWEAFLSILQREQYFSVSYLGSYISQNPTKGAVFLCNLSIQGAVFLSSLPREQYFSVTYLESTISQQPDKGAVCLSSLPRKKLCPPPSHLRGGGTIFNILTISPVCIGIGGKMLKKYFQTLKVQRKSKIKFQE